MRGPVSPDAALAHHIEGEGQIALFFKYGSLSQEAITKVLGASEDLLWLGRSVLGQVGVDVAADGQAVSHNGDGIYVPVAMEAYTPVGNALLDDVRTLTANTKPGETVTWYKQPLPIGRFADLSKLARQRPEEVRRDIDDGYISFGAGSGESDEQPTTYRLNDDGSVSVKLSPLEFIINDDHFLESTEGRISLLHEGRAAIARDSDHIYRREDELLPEFLLGGIRLSAGPRYWRVLTEVNNRLVQLKSAAMFDANRLMGIGQHLPEYDRNRQVELRKLPATDSSELPPTYGNTWIPVEFYRSTQIGQGSQGGSPNWLRMTTEQRRLRHAHGITALQALETAEPANREALFDITRQPGVAAAVLTRRGIQIVKETGSDKLNTRNTVAKLREAAQGIPDGLKMLTPLIEDLGTAGDRTATVVMEQVRLEDVGRLVTGGDARAIIFERFRDDGSETMTNEELSLLVDLSRQGIGIAWAQDGDYREFHPSGLWIKPGVSHRIEQLEMSVAIFGARREHIGKKYADQIGRFLDGLVDMFDGPEHLAVVHGNGSGIMRVGDEAARERGILSIGAGIDVERLGQDQVNKNADGRVNVVSSALLMRQHMLEVNSTIPILTDGGYGTVVELANSVCFRKLLLVLPTPIIVVDPSGIYEGFERLVDTISSPSDGEIDAPRHWMKNLIQFVDSFDEALSEVKSFKANPAQFWQQAGIPRQHIENAYEAHRKQLTQVGMRLPPFLQHGVRDFLANSAP